MQTTWKFQAISEKEANSKDRLTSRSKETLRWKYNTIVKQKKKEELKEEHKSDDPRNAQEKKQHLKRKASDSSTDHDASEIEDHDENVAASVTGPEPAATIKEPKLYGTLSYAEEKYFISLIEEPISFQKFDPLWRAKGFSPFTSQQFYNKRSKLKNKPSQKVKKAKQ